jgi:hypothetical protein
MSSTIGPRFLVRLLRASLGILLVAVLLAAAGHVHHDAHETTNCALCAIAHIPAIDATSPPNPPGLEFNPVSHPIARERAPEARAGAAHPARAPPLA